VIEFVLVNKGKKFLDRCKTEDLIAKKYIFKVGFNELPPHFRNNVTNSKFKDNFLTVKLTRAIALLMCCSSSN